MYTFENLQTNVFYTKKIPSCLVLYMIKNTSMTEFLTSYIMIYCTIIYIFAQWTFSYKESF